MDFSLRNVREMPPRTIGKLVAKFLFWVLLGYVTTHILYYLYIAIF